MAVLTLGDVKPYLKLQTTDSDADVDSFMTAAEAALAKRCGPLEATTVTARVKPLNGVLWLPTTPVISITSVTGRSGGTVTVAAGDVSTGGYIEGPYTFGEDYYTVVYSAGRATCPADLKMAARELVRHLWRTQRGAGVRQGGEDLPGSAYSFPIRVEQLIAPHLQHGFA